MSFLETFRMALNGLRNNVMRSLLTILGVIIGVTSVIVMVAIGEGSRQQVANQIQSLGTNMLIVMPGRTGRGSTGRGSFGSANVLTNKLVEKIRKEMSSAAAVAPETNAMRSIAYQGETLPSTVTGITTEYAQVRNLSLQSGSFFTERDEKAVKRVAILGPSIAEELFGDEDPLGKEVKIQGARYKVIGITKKKGQSGMNNEDDRVYAPFLTVQRRIIGDKHVRTIFIQAKENVSLDFAKQELDTILSKYLSSGEYSIGSQDEILSTAEETSQTFTLMLVGIASVSLIVGGIGIMNIMLVSVTERTREIGLRKAIGARRIEILLQFLSEAVILSLIGGILGVALGAIGAAVASKLLNMSTSISAQAVAIALAFSLAVGLFFGVYPANKASMLHPIEALRHE